MSENVAAWAIFNDIQDQVICGGLGGVLAISRELVPYLCSQYDPEDELDTFHKVRILTSLYVRSIQEQTRQKGAGGGRQSDDSPARGQGRRKRRP